MIRVPIAVAVPQPDAADVVPLAALVMPVGAAAAPKLASIHGLAG